VLKCIQRGFGLKHSCRENHKLCPPKQYSVVWYVIIPQCIPLNQIFFCGVSHNVKDYSVANPTLHCIPHHKLKGEFKKIFCGVSHIEKDYSVAYPTPHCIPLHKIKGELEKNILGCRYPRPQNNLPRRIPQYGKLFHSVSHNGEDYFWVYPTIRNTVFVENLCEFGTKLKWILDMSHVT